MKPVTIKGKRNYDNVHAWLKYHWGKANHCENKRCKGTSTNYQWALKRGKKYEKKRSNFFNLCRSCHSAYDFTEEGKKRLRALYKGVPNLHLSKRIYQYTLKRKFVRSYVSTAATEAYGFKPKNVARGAAGFCKTAHGFIWSYSLINQE